MATKRLKPDTPSRRFNVVPTFEEITKSKPERKLTVALRKTGGRNHHGKITSRRRGGGHKRRYRLIDFKRNKFDVIGTVIAIEYDPNRSSRIALIEYKDGERRYIIAPDGIKIDQKIISSSDKSVDFEVGNTMKMKFIPDGMLVHNIELKPGKGAQMARSAGCYARIMAKADSMITLKLPSGENVILTDTVGFISNLPTELISSFHSTLEEILFSDLIIHVRDLKSKNFSEDSISVYKTLKDIGLKDFDLENRVIEVFNKSDYDLYFICVFDGKR